MNWFGDVGGFSGPILMFFAYFGNWVDADALNSFLVSAIFRGRDKKKLTFDWSTIWCCRTKQKKMKDKGKERINKEVDIVKFVRN